MKGWIYVMYYVILAIIPGCYIGFKGISIPPEINTFFVENFETRAFNAPVEADVQFSEALRTKIRNESKLKLKADDPDVSFSGEITRYDVTAEAPREGNTVALNKLEITVLINYTNHRSEKDKYSRSYSFFRTFPGDQDLQSVQDALLKDIFNQLTEKIFNETFASW
ncbi:MAG: LptE family protein [Saprospiraceae bacterium]|nr:LptE family protein [Saprospiraceae bacterium]